MNTLHTLAAKPQTAPLAPTVTPHTYQIREISYVEWAAAWVEFKKTMAVRANAH